MAPELDGQLQQMVESAHRIVGGKGVGFFILQDNGEVRCVGSMSLTAEDWRHITSRLLVQKGLQ